VWKGFVALAMSAMPHAPILAARRKVVPDDISPVRDYDCSTKEQAIARPELTIPVTRAVPGSAGAARARGARPRRTRRRRP
jgi:hypothetical protein